MTIEAAIDAVAKKGRKYDQFLEAAGELFMEQGFNAVSMDAIVARAGISKSTAYSYFRSKEELFAAVVGDFCRKQAEAHHIGEIDSADPRRGVRQLATLAAHTILSPQAVCSQRILTAEAGKFPELGRRFFESGPRYLLGMIGGYLTQQVAAGHMPAMDTERAAWLLVGLAKGKLHEKLVWNVMDRVDDADIESQIDYAMQVFFAIYPPLV